MQSLVDPKAQVSLELNADILSKNGLLNILFALTAAPKYY